MQISSNPLFDKTNTEKALIFVSPGRCGTKRIAELLQEKLPNEFTVKHQMPFSRLANVIGNLLYYFGQSEELKETLYGFITSKYLTTKYFVSSDPLTAMIIPRKWVQNEKVCIVHITRNPDAFAESFFRFSRQNVKSFLAHNFIPFWQIGILPLENVISHKIKNKYRAIIQKKENLFDSAYTPNPNYTKIHIQDLFSTNYLEILIELFFNQNLSITQNDLSIKANQTKIDRA